MSAKMSFFGRLFWIMAFGCSAFGSIEFVKPIKSFIKLINVPLKISAVVCWDHRTKYDFLIKFQQPFLETDLENYQVSIVSDTMEKIPIDQDQHRNLIIIDLNCPNTSDLLQKIDSRVINRLKWIIISPNETDCFFSEPFLVDSESYCIWGNDDFYYVNEVYRRTPDTEIVVELIASYRNNSLKDHRTSDPLVRRRKNLMGGTLRASLVITNNDSLNHLHDYRDKHIDTISKVNYRLTNYLMDYLNATVRYKFVSQWGYLDNETGQWSGMIGDLVENRSDIGATALFFTSDRIQYIEYIAMPTPTLSKFVFRSPKLSYTDDVFLLPFDKLVWYCLVASFFVSALALIGSVFIEWQLFNARNDISDASVLKPSFYDTLVLVFAATCQQGSAVAPKSLTARIVMVVTYIALMFLYTSYSANIVALLQSPSTKIKTLDDLLSSRLRFGADDTVFNRYYFSHATEPIRRKIYELKILQKDGFENFMPLAEGVEKIRRGLFAFHMELGVGYKIMGETYFEHEKCGLQEIQYLQVIDPWYAIQKNSSFKELLKTGMMLLHEFGLQDRENSRLYTKKPPCASGGGKFITASVVDIRSALLLLAYGFLASIFLLIMEKLIYAGRKMILRWK